MRITHLVLPVLAAWLSTGCGTTPKPAGDGSLNLFNGRDLTGWHSYLSKHDVTTEDVWSVRDGLLVCQGEPMGYLYTAQPFQDFKLVVEYRWPADKPPGNSGILMRINGAPRALPRCLECQLKSGSAGDLYGFQGMKLSDPIERLGKIENHKLGGHLSALNRLATNEVKPGEWNVVEITLQGGDLTVVINGEKVNEAHGAEVVAGPIGLQSEGGEIQFRTVRLTPLGQ